MAIQLNFSPLVVGEKDIGECCVCLENKERFSHQIDEAHHIVCRDCLHKLAPPKACPLCRKKITHINGVAVPEPVKPQPRVNQHVEQDASRRTALMFGIRR